MAKTDSFFIRKALAVTTDGNFFQDTIDLGAYVDALGKSVLRILNISVNWSDATGRTPNMSANASGSADFQLTTQSQTDMVIVGDNKSVVASGRLTASSVSAGTPAFVNDALDYAPQHWSNGYLIAVDSLYLGGAATTAGWNEELEVSIVMECVSESLSKEASIALALSQQ
jgi:hypothetical protein